MVIPTMPPPITATSASTFVSSRGRASGCGPVSTQTDVVSHARRSASSSRRISDSALRPFVTRCSGGQQRERGEHAVGVLGHRHERPAVLGLQLERHRGGAGRAALGAQAEAARALGLERDGVIGQLQRTEADRVVELRAGRRPLGLGVADDLRADDPVAVAVGVGQDVPDRLAGHRHVSLVRRHRPGALPTRRHPSSFPAHGRPGHLRRPRDGPAPRPARRDRGRHGDARGRARRLQLGLHARRHDGDARRAGARGADPRHRGRPYGRLRRRRRRAGAPARASTRRPPTSARSRGRRARSPPATSRSCSATRPSGCTPTSPPTRRPAGTPRRS